MKNFIFKSQKDFHKIVFNKLETIQSELRAQRVDHVHMAMNINKLFVELNLQKQADSYYDKKMEDDKSDFETSHQTELEEQV